MNLHALAVGQISAVNPVITVGIDVSVGYTSNPDATRTPKFATPGALTASISGTVMTVTLSADHRVIDGAVAAEWMAAFVRRVEHPVSLLL